MNTTRPTRIVVAGCAALAIGLTGCGSSESPKAAEKSTTPASTPAGSSSSQAPAQAVTVEYLHRLPDGEGMTKVADIVKKWNAEHPNIQVKATKFDGKSDEMIKKLENDVKAGTAPCLAQTGYAEIPSLFTKGLLEDVSAEAGKYQANFSAGAMGMMKVGPATVGLPQDTGPLVYYYNKAEFTKLGLTAPKTMDELAESAKKAAAKGKYIVDFQTDEAQYGLSAMAAAAGATWYAAENDQWKVNVTSPETAKVTTLWQGLIDSKATLVEERWGEGFKKALVSQKLIGTIGAAWEAPLLAGDMAKSPNEGQWAVAQLPTFGDKAMTGPDGGSGVSVMKGCKNPAEAMEFNNWFNTQIDDLATQGLVVAANGTVKTPEALAKFYGGQDVMAELGKANAALNPNFTYMPTWPAVHDAMTKAAADAGAGKGKVAAIFEGAQTASQKSLKDAGLPVAG